MTVDSTGDDYSYPIVADPEIVLEKLLPVFQEQTHYVTNQPAWAAGGVWTSSWIYQHPARVRVNDADGTPTSWWMFWSQEYGDWVLMQDMGGSNYAYFYFYVTLPVFAQIPILDHYDYIPASSWLSAVSFSDGAEETPSATDMADVNTSPNELAVDAITMSPTNYASAYPHCRHPHVSITLGIIGGGHMDFRFCHNNSKHTAALATTMADGKSRPWNNHGYINAAVGIGTLGNISEDGDEFTPHYLHLGGDANPHSQMQGDAQFTVEGSFPTGPLGISVPLQTPHWGAYAWWDGSVHKYANG